MGRETLGQSAIMIPGPGSITFHRFAFVLSAHSTASNKHLISLLTGFLFIQYFRLRMSIMFRQMNVTACTWLCNTRDHDQEFFFEVKK